MTDTELMAVVNRYTEACDDLGAGLFEQTEAQTAAKHSNAAELYSQIQSEVKRLHHDLAKAWRIRMEFGDIISNQCMAMQAALIERSIGKGDEAALEWIANTLDGPGLLPSMSDAAHLPTTPEAGPAQAWFDAKTAEHEALRKKCPKPEALAAGTAPVLGAA